MPAEALGSYLRGILRHRLLFTAIVLACLLGTVGWLAHRSPVYEATASILVSPIPASDQTLVGLPLVRATDQEPERVPKTAATLIQQPAAARAAAQALGADSPAALANAVSVEPRSNTSIVDVTARAASAVQAANLANAYAKGALRARDEILAAEARGAISQTERNLASVPPGGTADALRVRLGNLRSVALRGDPTLSLAAAASTGVAQGPAARLALVLALGSGLILASLTIVLIELLAPRPIEDESELSATYPLPVLSRVPSAALGDDLQRPLAEAPAALREGFRALRGQLELRAGDRAGDNGGRGSTVLVVSPGATDWRTSCSLNLARSFVSVRETVTVVELDLRNPRMAVMLGADPRHDIGELASGLPLETVAVHLDGSDGMRLIAAPPAIDLDRLEQVMAGSAEIVDASRRLSNWIIVDAPPMSEAADALIAAASADHIVVVVRLGSTSPAALAYVHELFEQAGRIPDGYVVVSTPAARPHRTREGIG